MSLNDRLERGQSLEETQLAARKEFGNVGLVKIVLATFLPALRAVRIDPVKTLREE